MSNSVLLCMGTRPEIIKMAPVYFALKNSPLQPIVVHTGQHNELAWPFYKFFGMQPDFSIELQRTRPSLGHLTSLLLDKIEPIIGDTAPRAILVQGDTTTALAAAMNGFYQQIPVGHIEAGLRSRRFYNPFPEEKNREMVARLAHWHFAPTTQAVANLVAEGIAHENIYQVGNTIVDATNWCVAHLPHFFAHAREETDAFMQQLPSLENRRLVVVTAHRRENWHGPIQGIAHAVAEIAKKHPDVVIVWPVHGNPEVAVTVRDALRNIDSETAKRIVLLPPIPYPHLLWALHRSWAILTDSGGLQEEAATLHVPVLVLRDTTERQELIEAGGGKLIGTNAETITSWFDRLTSDADLYHSMKSIKNPFGDGRAALRITQTLVADLVAETTPQAASA